MSKGRWVTPEETAEIVRLYHIEELSLRETAAVIGRDWSGVRGVLRRMGIPLRGRGYTNIVPDDPGDLTKLASRLFEMAEELETRAAQLLFDDATSKRERQSIAS